MTLILEKHLVSKSEIIKIFNVCKSMGKCLTRNNSLLVVCLSKNIEVAAYL